MFSIIKIKIFFFKSNDDWPSHYFLKQALISFQYNNFDYLDYDPIYYL